MTQTKHLAQMVLPRLSSKKCWETIKEDVMNAIVQLNNLNIAHLQWLNSANIFLLTKKDRAKDVADYKPINLIHAITKLITKIISLWLAPLMEDLVSNAQSAFIKRSSIYDNFMHVQNLERRLHKSKITMLILMFEKRKSFGSVRWNLY
jgi:hypothetical protein